MIFELNLGFSPSSLSHLTRIVLPLQLLEFFLHEADLFLLILIILAFGSFVLEVVGLFPQTVSSPFLLFPCMFEHLFFVSSLAEDMPLQLQSSFLVNLLVLPDRLNIQWYTS